MSIVPTFQLQFVPPYTPLMYFPSLDMATAEYPLFAAPEADQDTPPFLEM
jgi:hypothetical protein